MLIRLTVEQCHSGTYHVGRSIQINVREVYSWYSLTALLYHKIVLFK